jgi:hypothetical protein
MFLSDDIFGILPAFFLLFLVPARDLKQLEILMHAAIAEYIIPKTKRVTVHKGKTGLYRWIRLRL